MKAVLKSKKFWGGVIAGTIAGPWLFGKIASTTGVSIGLPSAGGG